MSKITWTMSFGDDGNQVYSQPLETYFIIPFSCRGSFVSIHTTFNTMSYHLQYTATTITKITREEKATVNLSVLFGGLNDFINYSLTHTKITLSEKCQPFTRSMPSRECLLRVSDVLPGLSAAAQKSEGSESDWRVGSARLTWEGSVCLHLPCPHVLAAWLASVLRPAGPGFCLYRRAAPISNRIQTHTSTHAYRNPTTIPFWKHKLDLEKKEGLKHVTINMSLKLEVSCKKVCLKAGNWLECMIHATNFKVQKLIQIKYIWVLMPAISTLIKTIET